MATESLAPFNADAIDPEEARAIEIYEMQLGRVQAGQMPEEIFSNSDCVTAFMDSAMKVHR